MAYTLDKTIKGMPFDAVVAATREALSTKGFGVLTEIDVRATMKKKLDVDVADYLILGACNPMMALEAMKMEPRVGAMLALQCDRAIAGGRDHHGQRHRSRRLDASDRQSPPQDGRWPGEVSAARRRRRDLRHWFPCTVAGCLSGS